MSRTSLGDEILLSPSPPYSWEYGDDDHLIATSISRQVARFWRHWTLEPEVGIGQRFGRQSATELWGALFFRYSGFPWDRHVVTTAALSTGLNWASEVTEVEQDRAQDDEGSQWMHFFSPEITFAAPSRPNVELVLRFHHRSGVFGPGQRRLGRGAVRERRGAGAVLRLAPRGGRGVEGAAAGSGQVSATLSKRKARCPVRSSPASLAMAAIVVLSNVLVQFLRRRLADLGRLHLSVRLPGHRPDEPAARAGGGAAGGGGGLRRRARSAASSERRSRGRSGRWSACGWRSARGRRSWSGSSWTSRSSTGCGRGAGGGRRWSRACSAAWSTPRSSSRSPSRRRWRSSRRRSTSAWANEAVPLLGRGPVAPLWVSLAVADFSVKLAIAVLALAPFRAALGLAQARGAR